MTGLLGKKIGMTRVIQDDGRVIPITVIQCDPNEIAQVKTVEKDGYPAIVLGFSKIKKPTKTRKFYFMKEFRIKGDEAVKKGDLLNVEIFKEGDKISITSTSKGKGFQGVVRRFKFAGQPETHGSMMHRRNGAIGNRLTPGRVWKNMGMPGHMGDERITIQNLEIVQVREADGVILVSGAIPGAKGTFVVVRPSIKKSAKKAE